MAEQTAQATPTLSFRLPGEWIVIDPRDDSSARARIEESVRETVGPADDAAILRGRLRETLIGALEGAQQAGAEMLYLCQEIAGVPIPMAISVHFPQDLRMSPAIGTSPAAVLAVLRQSFQTLNVTGIGEAVELEIEGSRILRTVRIDEQRIEAEGSAREQRRISADYWYTLPGTKNVVLVNMASALGDVPTVILGLFDSIVQASFFDLPAEAQALVGEPTVED